MHARRPIVGLGSAVKESDLRSFPSDTWAAGRSFYRVARKSANGEWLSPWWFCQCGQDRFDLPVDYEVGTLCAGSDRITGVLEYLGDAMNEVISTEFLDERRGYELAYNASFPLANMCSKRATGFGITNATMTGPDYQESQEWAFRFAELPVDGLRYRARTVIDGPGTALALFDEPGAHDWPIRDLYELDSHELLEELSERGVRVAPVPRLTDISIVE